MENPATSAGAAFLFATIAHAGESGFAEYWQALVDNDVQVDEDWDTAYYGSFTQGGGGGDRPLVVSYASSPRPRSSTPRTRSRPSRPPAS
ncbi:MAG: hypothetical protein R2715_05135 [Ilumatobacteraceae bacterium]